MFRVTRNIKSRATIKALTFSTRILKRSPAGVYTYSPQEVITPGGASNPRATTPRSPKIIIPTGPKILTPSIPKVLTPTNYPPLDWIQKGAVTPIKDQGEFNTCWGFGGMVPVEAINFFLTGKLLSFSEQYVIDNSPGKGCWKSGYPQWVYKVAMLNGGLPLMKDYPYTMPYNNYYDQVPIVPLPLIGYRWLDTGNILEILDVLKWNPVTVTFPVFMELLWYNRKVDIIKTITYPRKKGLQRCRHIVAIVGLGWNEEDGEPYWLLKNSWGRDDGTDGTLKVACRCDIFTSALYPIFETFDPKIGRRSSWRPPF